MPFWMRRTLVERSGALRWSSWKESTPLALDWPAPTFTRGCLLLWGHSFSLRLRSLDHLTGGAFMDIYGREGPTKPAVTIIDQIPVYRYHDLTM